MYTAQYELIIMHTTGCMQLNYTKATMLSNYLASVKALQARNGGQARPCHLNVHGVTHVAA